MVADFPRADRCDPSAWDPVIEAVTDTKDASGVPMAILATLPETMPEGVADRLVSRGIVPLCGVDDGLRAIEAAAWLGHHEATADRLLPVAGEPSRPRVLSEADAKACLAEFGVRVPKGVLVNGQETLAAAVDGLSFPVALKASGAAHKTETGGVVLGLHDTGSVVGAAKRMNAHEYLVEEMVADGIVELLVGVLRDPASGFVLTLGAGGTLAEIHRDTVSLLVPASRAEIGTALSKLRIAPLFDGYRGAAPVDRQTLLAAIDAVQDCVAAHAEGLLELEINPLIVTPDRAVAADALIKMGEAR